MINKILLRLQAILLSPLTFGLVITGVFTWLAIGFYAFAGGAHTGGAGFAPVFTLMHSMHQKSIDLRMNFRGPIAGSDRVAILTIDEKAIEQEGRWPWPREKIARAVENAVQYGAKILAFDIIFSDPDPNSSIPTLHRMLRKTQAQGQSTPQLTEMFQQEIQSADSDMRLAEVIQRNADHLVMGAYFDHRDQEYAAHQDMCLQHLYNRSGESAYWKKEQIFTFVSDDFERQLPPGWSDHLEAYLTRLETDELENWLEKNPDLRKAMQGVLANHSLELEEAALAPVMHLILGGRRDELKATLGEINPALKEDPGINGLVAAGLEAVPDKMRARLNLNQRTAGDYYCFRFLDPERDELLNIELYEKKWGEKTSFNDWSWSATWPAVQQAAASFKDVRFERGIAQFVNDSHSNRVPQVARWWLNIPLFEKGTKHTGYFNADQDSDGTIRRSMIVVRKGNSYMPSLALKAFLAIHGYGMDIRMSASPILASTKIISEFNILDEEGEKVMKVPVDGSGRLPINFAGPRMMFPYVSLAELLNESPKVQVDHQVVDKNGNLKSVNVEEFDKAEFFKDKVFVVGATATGIFDLRVTPFEKDFPGLETHANVLSNLMVEHERARAGGKKVTASGGRDNRPGFLVTHPQEELYMMATLLGVGVVLSALLSHLGAVSGLLVMIAALSVIAIIDRFALFGNGVVVSVLLPLALIFSLYVTLTFYKYFTEERKKRELKGTFEKYVSPSIVAEILSDPSKIELGGRKTDLTVMFSDVRGFTTISEKLDPRALSDLLNSYLTPMTELVFTHKGTLDKYMGDAIMAFWGAPIHFADHAQHACRCALHSLVKLKELQAQYRAQGLPEIDIGIGLNTGEMSVGNMGSDTVRSYTVMGDAVNLGSRLEGINKQYGTRIIISEFTKDAIGDGFVTREVDWVRVKGKVEPVRIFELVAEHKAEPTTAEMLKWFQDGFNLYHERLFDRATAAFTHALNANPADACSKLYIQRCHDYQAEPPPENWDGVYTMTSK